ncbi:MAG: AEC family transporter [Chloroflexota bacterium]
MIQLLQIFLNNLAPIFLAAGAGYLLGHVSEISPRGLSQVVYYIFGPCLLFTLLTGSRLAGSEIARVMGFAALSILVTGLLTWLAGKALRLEQRMLAAVLLVSMFMNAGNFGLPVVMFAFGQTALSYASLFFAMSSILAYTLGTVIASAGSMGLLRSIVNLYRVPIVYSLALALLFMNTGWQIPLFLQRTTKILGDASIPAMLVLLGMQLHQAAWRQYKLPLALGSLMRLVVSPLAALLLARAGGFSRPAFQAVTLQAGMPTAVLNTVLATEFDAEPAFVSSAVFVNTLLSPLTLTPMLYLLGA